MTTKTRRYVSVTETAKLVRAALKKAFPGFKFSVRSDSYAGGASIRVKWTDGPMTKQVQAVTSPYCGGGFDGMIDMKYHVESWLMPDGSATFAKTTGTAGSKGMVDSAQEMQPSFKAELVHFGADFIFCDREYTTAFYGRAVDKVCREYGLDSAAVKIKTHSDGTSPYVDRSYDPPLSGHRCLSDLVYQELVKRVDAKFLVNA